MIPSIEQKTAWLQIAFQQDPTDFSELFYYDRQTAVFFSICIIDQLMFNHDMQLIRNLPLLYSPVEISAIQNRINRIESKHHSVIELPRLGILDLASLSRKIEEYLKNNKIEIGKSKFHFVFQGESAELSFEKVSKIPLFFKNLFSSWKGA